MNIKTLSLQSAVCAMAIFATSQAFAASQATANASATVLAPISITKVNDINFGSFVSGTSAGFVALTPESATIKTGAGVINPDGDGSAAKFSVTGLSNGVFSITLPTSATLTATGGATMTVDTFTTDLSQTAATLSAGGLADLYVGATLQVGDAQEAGTYTGTFDVSVNYN